MDLYFNQFSIQFDFKNYIKNTNYILNPSLQKNSYSNPPKRVVAQADHKNLFFIFNIMYNILLHIFISTVLPLDSEYPI